jgi:hypothetical protein
MFVNQARARTGEPLQWMCQRIGVDARVDKSSTRWTNCLPDFSNSAKSEWINKNGLLPTFWNVPRTRTDTLQNQPRGTIGNDAAPAARAPKATAFAAKPIDRKPTTVTSSLKAIRHFQKMHFFNCRAIGRTKDPITSAAEARAFRRKMIAPEAKTMAEGFELVSPALNPINFDLIRPDSTTDLRHS